MNAFDTGCGFPTRGSRLLLVFAIVFCTAGGTWGQTPSPWRGQAYYRDASRPQVGSLTPDARSIAIWQSPPEQSRPVDQITRLQFSQRSAVTLSPGDWRRMVFPTGERWHVRLERLRTSMDQPLRWSLRGGSSLSQLPPEMARLDPPQFGEILGLNDDETTTQNPYVSFPKSSVKARDEGSQILKWRTLDPSSECVWPEAIATGGVSFHFEAHAGAGRCVVEFLTDQGALQVTLASSSGNYLVFPPKKGDWNLFPVAVQTGSRTLTLLLHQGRLTVTVDGHLLAQGHCPGLRLLGMRLSGEGMTDEAASPIAQAQLDQLTVWRESHSLVRLVNLPQEDQLLLKDGVEVFGLVQKFTSAGILFHSRKTATTWPWEEISRLIRKQGNAAPIIWTGLLIRLEAQPLADTLREESDWLWGTWTELDEHNLTLDHASLGKIRIPLPDITRIEPLHRGWSSELLPGGIHLGDEVHPEFSRVLPQATCWETDVPATSLKPANPVLRVELSELEPSGLLADPQSRFLKELRAGHLTTELWWNDRKLVVLNSLISARAPKQRPQILRIPIPIADWKPNGNKISLRQEPLSEGQSQYDDCEIHILRLELDSPAR